MAGDKENCSSKAGEEDRPVKFMEITSQRTSLKSSLIAQKKPLVIRRD